MLIPNSKMDKLEEALDSLTEEQQAEFKKLTARMAELVGVDVNQASEEEDEKSEFEYAFEMAMKDINRHVLSGVRNHTNTLLLEIKKIASFVGYKFGESTLNEEEAEEKENKSVRGSAFENWVGAMTILEEVLEAYMVTYAQEEETPEIDARTKEAYENLADLLERFRYEKFPVAEEEQFIVLLMPTVLRIVEKTFNLWTRTDFSKQYAYQNFCKKFDKMIEDCFKDLIILIKNSRRMAA